MSQSALPIKLRKDANRVLLVMYFVMNTPRFKNNVESLVHNENGLTFGAQRLSILATHKRTMSLVCLRLFLYKTTAHIRL